MHVATTNGIDLCGGGGPEGKRTLDLAQDMVDKLWTLVNTVKELRIA